MPSLKTQLFVVLTYLLCCCRWARIKCLVGATQTKTLNCCIKRVHGLSIMFGDD